MSSALTPREPSGARDLINAQMQAELRAAMDRVKELQAALEEEEKGEVGLVSVRLSMADIGRMYHAANCSCPLTTDPERMLPGATKADTAMQVAEMRQVIDEAAEELWHQLGMKPAGPSSRGFFEQIAYENPDLVRQYGQRLAMRKAAAGISPNGK